MTVAEGSNVYAQFAMLYTDMYGERKIRVFNFSWIVQKTLFNYFKSTEVTNFSMFKIRQELSTATKIGV